MGPGVFGAALGADDWRIVGQLRTIIALTVHPIPGKSAEVLGRLPAGTVFDPITIDEHHGERWAHGIFTLQSSGLKFEGWIQVSWGDQQYCVSADGPRDDCHAAYSRGFKDGFARAIETLIKHTP